MKKIITHISPHLDEIVAIWLIQKFDPGWADCQVDYKATNPQGGEVDLEAVDKDPDVLYLGLGRSKFDEHKLDKEAAAHDCAATLVWKDIKSRGLSPTDPDKLAGIEKLLEFILKEDTGELKSMDHFLSDFTIEALWAGFSQYNRGDSEKKLAYGLPLVDYMVTNLTNVAGAERELQTKAQKFETPWGPAVAIESESGTVGTRAYRQGYVLLIGINPKLGYRRFTGKTGSEVDLTDAYNKLKELDPDADWYLHQSKRMLLSGSHSAPNVKISKLSLQQLVDIVKV